MVVDFAPGRSSSVVGEHLAWTFTQATTYIRSAPDTKESEARGKATCGSGLLLLRQPQGTCTTGVYCDSGLVGVPLAAMSAPISNKYTGCFAGWDLIQRMIRSFGTGLRANKRIFGRLG